MGINISCIPKISKKLNFEDYIFSIVSIITHSKSDIKDQEVIKLDGSFDIEHPLVTFETNITETMIQKAIEYSYNKVNEFFENREKQINNLSKEILLDIISNLLAKKEE